MNTASKMTATTDVSTLEIDLFHVLHMDERGVMGRYSIICPHCGEEVKLIPFGGGWVGICCGKIVYNSRKLPENDREFARTSEVDKDK